MSKVQFQTKFQLISKADLDSDDSVHGSKASFQQVFKLGTLRVFKSVDNGSKSITGVFVEGLFAQRCHLECA